ncbi:MAG: DNRLRE domain-containing protein [Myxococcota bacterium]
MRSPGRGRAGFVLISVMLVLAIVAAVAFLLNRTTAIDVRLGVAALRRLEARYAAEAGVEHASWLLNRAGCTGYTDLPATAFGNHAYAAAVAPNVGPRVGITARGTLADGTRQIYSRADVPVFQTVSTTLQPGASTDDATINALEPDKNYGGEPKITVSNFGAEVSHALLRFDISALPADATVVAATLRLYLEAASESPPGAEVIVHRLTRDWVEGTMQGAEPADGATWLTHDGSNPWATPGGEVEPTPAATLSLGPVGQSYDADVTSVVSGWQGGASPNYGFRLEGSAGVKAVEFMSGDEADVAKQPQLIIAYRSPCPPLAPPNTTILQPVADTYITPPPPILPHGWQTYARIGVSNNDSQYALLRFDVLSVVPANATISSAVLRVYESRQFGAQSFTVSAHRIAQDWVELANWTYADWMVEWVPSAGGTYDPGVLDTAVVNTGNGWREWNVTPLVQEWVDGVSPDRGIQLIHGPVASENYIEFYPRESAQPEKPNLTVSYVP